VDYYKSVGYGGFTSSQNGILVYTQGSLSRSQLTWFDRGGKVLSTMGAAWLY
jgi:hypothetical protein